MRNTSSYTPALLRSFWLYLSVCCKLRKYNATDIIFRNCLYDQMRASWLPSEPPPSRSGYRRVGGKLRQSRANSLAVRHVFSGCTCQLLAPRRPYHITHHVFNASNYSRGSRAWIQPRRVIYASVLTKLTKLYKTDGGPTRPAQNQEKEPSFGDSSGPFFSIYSKAAEEEDNKMVERWQKDADGILIFVSSSVGIYVVLYAN